MSGEQVSLTLHGKSAHGANPASGLNGGTYLAAFLVNYDFGGSAADFLAITANYLHNEPKGEKLTIAHTDDVMGELSLNPGVFIFDATDPAVQNAITLNIRYPKGVTEAGMQETLETVLQDYTFEVAIEPHGHTPHYVSGEDQLVQTLLAVYEEHTGLPGHEQVIGGGTFGRLLERGVAYGAMFPDSVDTMHQANEFMAVDDLVRATAIYADAIYRLIK